MDIAPAIAAAAAVPLTKLRAIFFCTFMFVSPLPIREHELRAECAILAHVAN